MHKLRHRFPRIGMRIFKSALAVGLCCFMSYLLGGDGIPFFIVIAAMQCMQPYQRNIREVAAKNIFGTLIGAGCGVLILLLQYFVLDRYNAHYIWYCVAVTFGIACSLYTAVVLNCGEMAHFSAVVFLCMVMAHIGNENPYLYILQRLGETMVGIVVGTVINGFHLPRKKKTDTLYVASLDDILHSEFSHLPEYCKVALNRILDDGIPLSVMTSHTVASFLESAGSIRFKLPVILVDGAVLYDPVNHCYLEKKDMIYEEIAPLVSNLEGMGLDVFKSSVIDDSFIIFYDRLHCEGAQDIYRKLRTSPYRNYINRPLPEGLPVVYILAIDSTDKIRRAYDMLKTQGITEKYKVLCLDFHDHPGYSYLRILHKDATRDNMLKKLQELTGYENIRTLGRDSDSFDIKVHSSEGEDIIKKLRRISEPVCWRIGKNNRE